MLGKPVSRKLLIILFAHLVFGRSFLQPTNALSYTDPPLESNDWIQIPQNLDDNLEWSFVLLAESNWLQLSKVQDVIETSGGRVVHTFPYQAVIARAPFNAGQVLQTLPGVAAVHSEPLAESGLEGYGLVARDYARVWNDLIAAPPTPADLAAAAHPNDQPDALVAPDVPPTGRSEITSSSVITPGYYQTSEYMAGRVAVGIVLVESDGSIDTSTEDWTADEKQQVFSEIVAGLNWWAQLEPRANLSFIYDDHFSNPLPTGVEPIGRPYYHQQYWIGDAMNGLGYVASSYFSQVRDYDNQLRTTYQTDWAFTIFVVDSSNDSDNRFTDGFFAYAYLGGPFMVMTSGNNGYGPGNMDAIAAHEMGHIFHALDQYYNAYQACNRRAGYLDVENQNSQYGACTSNTSSIMRGQTYPYTAHALDTYAAGQIGWRDSDGDHIFDPLDVDLSITIDSISQSGNQVTLSGSTQIAPFPSPNQTSVTINQLTGVSYRLNGGAWQPATALDGVFDGTTENYQTTIPSLLPGLYTLEVTALDSAGNLSDIFAAEHIAIPDPIDGGLNTVIDPPGSILSGQAMPVNGLAYHMDGISIAKVEYRLNGGPWHAVNAQDGVFDSDYEPFQMMLNPLAEGSYLLEAFATDANGQVEANVASYEFEVRENRIFLPTVFQGM